MDSAVVFTEILKKRKGELNPVIVSFQNGDLTEYGKLKSKVKLTTTPNGDGTTVKVTTSNKHEFIPDESTNTKKRNILAVRNRKSNKVKLVEVDYVSLMNSILAKRHTSVVSQKDEKAALTLNKSFGGKKAQRRFDQNEKLNIDASIVQDELQEAVKGLDFSQTGNMSNSEDDGMKSLLPPCNREATHVSDVYSLIKMIGDEELEILKGEVEKVISDADHTKMCSEFFHHCLKQVMKKQANLEVEVAGLLYVELLISYINIPLKHLKPKSKQICDFSEIIRNRILDDFSVRTDTAINRPLSMKDKTVCYIMAIATVCCQYAIDLQPLSKSTGFNIKKLSQLARYIGLIPAGKECTLHVLKLPLPPMPKTTKKMKKQNR